jgi:uncharacterized protein (TIGR00730 family)
MMKRVTVFCGASSGTDAVYVEQAHALGKALGAEGLELVYGGAKIGLMGAVADATLAAGAKVTGVLPGFLKTKEVAHESLSVLILVDTMHERKLKMHELSDAIIALPGGYGTLEELFEMLTWGQLGLHKKPVGLLNVNGFYDELIAFADTMVKKGFLKPLNRQMLLISSDVNDLLKQLKNYQAPEVEQWIDRSKI